MGSLVPDLKCFAWFSANLLEDDGQRAEPREGGLKQVEADEGGEPEPVDTDVVRQAQRKQYGDACEGENDALDIQVGSPLVREKN